jgi:hypothetical protein
VEYAELGIGPGAARSDSYESIQNVYGFLKFAHRKERATEVVQCVFVYRVESQRGLIVGC